MHTAVTSARAAELDPFLKRTEERLTFLLKIRAKRQQRAELARALAALDRELADLAEPLRLALLEAGVTPIEDTWMKPL